jgi:hypothetical protein
MDASNLIKKNRILKIAYFVLLIISCGFIVFAYFFNSNISPNPEADAFARFFIPALLATAVLFPFLFVKKKLNTIQDLKPEQKLNSYFRYTIRSFAYAEAAILFSAATFSKTGNEMYLLYALVGLLILILQFPSDQKFNKIVHAEG